MTPKREYDFPEPPEIEVIQDISEYIADPSDNLKVRRLVIEHAQIGVHEKELKKLKAPITAEIKKLMGAYRVSKALCDSFQVLYYGASRAHIDKDKLVIALLNHGVSSAVIHSAIHQATRESTVWTLKVTAPGAKDDED